MLQQNMAARLDEDDFDIEEFEVVSQLAFYMKIIFFNDSSDNDQR